MRLLLPLLCACATVPKPPPIDAARIDAAAAKEIGDNPTAGVSVAIARGGEIVLARGYGVADVEAKTPAPADTRYPIMSVSKAITAVAVLKLVEEGRLSLEDPVGKWFPELPAGVTVYHLVTHTSGIRDFWMLDDYKEQSPARPAEVVPILAKTPVEFAPGEKFDYVNSNYLVLGLIVEKVSGRPLADVLAEVVFRPAGMTATSLDCKDGARGYRVEDKTFVAPNPFTVPPGDGSASVCSTAPDLARFGQALVVGKLLRPETVKRMLAPAHLGNGKEIEFGLGMELEQFDERPVATIEGGGSGFAARFNHFREEGITVAVLANTATNAVARLRFYAGRAARGVPLPVATPRPLPDAEREAFVGDYQFEGFVMHIYLKDGDVWARVNDPAGEKLVYIGDGIFGGTEEPDLRLELRGPKLTMRYYGVRLLAERVPK